MTRKTRDLAMNTHANPHLQSWLATLAQARVEVSRTAATVTHSGRLTRAPGSRPATSVWGIRNRRSPAKPTTSASAWRCG